VGAGSCTCKRNTRKSGGLAAAAATAPTTAEAATTPAATAKRRGWREATLLHAGLLEAALLRLLEAALFHSRLRLRKRPLLVKIALLRLSVAIILALGLARVRIGKHFAEEATAALRLGRAGVGGLGHAGLVVGPGCARRVRVHRILVEATTL